MNKHLRLSFIAIACSLAITACSSDNKGATRYEDLVKNKVDEANKKAEEKAKKDKESETAKKLADLEKKQKELEQQLREKNQNDNGSNNIPSEPEKKLPQEVPKTDNREDMKDDKKDKPNTNTKSLSVKDIQDKLDTTFIDNTTSNNSSLSGSLITNDNGVLKISNIDKTSQQNLNKLIIDNTEIVLFSDDFIKEAASSGKVIKTESIQHETGKVGSLPPGKYRDNYEQLRYGYITKDGKTTLFVQGHMTPSTKVDGGVSSPFSYYGYYTGKTSETRILRELPTEGVYAYEGTTFYGKDNAYSEFKTSGYADFGNKKVKIEVPDAKLVFGGKISGNSFGGNYDGIVTKGAFYGTKGVDIGGTFYQTKGDDAGKNGVFGLTQKDCTTYGNCSSHKDPNVIKDFEVNK